MSELLEPRGVFRPTTCIHCRRAMYTDTAWDHGQLVLLARVCADCEADEPLFEVTP